MSDSAVLHDNGDGTVTDTQSGHVWRAVPELPAMDWHEAQALEGMPYLNPKAATFGGVSEVLYAWRLPTHAELLGLNRALWGNNFQSGTYNDGRDESFFRPFRERRDRYFPHLQQITYWTRDASTGAEDAALGVSFRDLDVAVTVHTRKYVQQGVLLVLGRRDGLGG